MKKLTEKNKKKLMESIDFQKLSFGNIDNEKLITDI